MELDEKLDRGALLASQIRRFKGATRPVKTDNLGGIASSSRFIY